MTVRVGYAWQKGNIGNAIVKTDHAIKENRLFIDTISVLTIMLWVNCVIMDLLLRKIKLRKVRELHKNHNILACWAGFNSELQNQWHIGVTCIYH